MCVFFSCSTSNGLTPQRPHLVLKKKEGGGGTSSWTIRIHHYALREYFRAALVLNQQTYVELAGESYAVEEGRDWALERNRGGATSPFNYLTHKTIIYRKHGTFQSSIYDLCSSVYRSRVFLIPPLVCFFRASFKSLKACGVNNSEQENSGCKTRSFDAERQLCSAKWEGAHRTGTETGTVGETGQWNNNIARFLSSCPYCWGCNRVWPRRQKQNLQAENKLRPSTGCFKGWRRFDCSCHCNSLLLSRDSTGEIMSNYDGL